MFSIFFSKSVFNYNSCYLRVLSMFNFFVSNSDRGKKSDFNYNSCDI